MLLEPPNISANKVLLSPENTWHEAFDLCGQASGRGSLVALPSPLALLHSAFELLLGAWVSNVLLGQHGGGMSFVGAVKIGAGLFDVLVGVHSVHLPAGGASDTYSSRSPTPTLK